jgi:hypothetical protein
MAPTSLPLMWMVALRVLEFTIDGCFGKDASNARHGMGRHKKTAVVLVNSAFSSLNTTTTIGIFEI